MGSDTYRDVDANEENLKMLVLDKNRVCQSAKLKRIYRCFGLENYVLMHGDVLQV